MKIIIVEEEQDCINLLRILLNQLDDPIHLLATASGGERAVDLICQHRPDLVFWNIKPGDEQQLMLAEYFDPIPFKLIFTTAYKECQIHAFRLPAIDFLIKPIQLNALKEAIEKAKVAINHNGLSALAPRPRGNRPSKLSIATHDGFIFIEIERIVRCKADGRYSTFYMEDGTQHVAARNLGEFESQLCVFDFLRIHRSQIINLNKIIKFVRGKPAEVVMEDEARVVVSHGQRELLLSFLGL